MTRVLVLLAVLATFLAAAPAVASADYALSHDAGSDTLTITAGTLSSVHARYSALGSASLEISSPSNFRFTDATAGRCQDKSAPDRTSFSCPRWTGITRVLGTPNVDTLDALCIGTRSPVFFVGDAGDDKVTVTTCRDGDVDLGAGDDFSTGAQNVRGGDGNDTLIGSTGDDVGVQDGDVLDGGEGRDAIEGGDGGDTLKGGGGRDVLLAGMGTDAIEGGDGLDTVSFEDRANGKPLTISLNGAADDGEAGENDMIAIDVENLIGSPGPDTIIGDIGPNDIDAGDGDDVIDGGGGVDFVHAGPANDRVISRDGVPDRIECGPDNDVAVTDEFDTTSGCETVQASRELMPDVDNDGIPAPADCNDRDPRIRPGLPDKPGNRMDEDCSGADAPLTRIVTPVQSQFAAGNRFTLVRRLRVLDVPAGAVIELRCRGGRKLGCFRGVKRSNVPRGAAAKDIRRPVRRSRLKPRAMLEVRVLREDSIGKIVRFTMRSRRRLPTSRLLCMTPGTSRQGRC